MSASSVPLIDHHSAAKPWFRHLLACPDCGGSLDGPATGGSYECRKCGFRSSTDGARGVNQPDLRPSNPASLGLTLSRALPRSVASELETLDTGRPEITYAGPAPVRDSRELLSAVMGRLPAGAAVLDLGCGSRDQAACFEWLGGRYVGVDVQGDAADLLADAHALPFADGSFDCVFSYAVLEHLWSPQVAVREIVRVLRPGGVYVGTVSQGEPFHASYCHFTAWGLLALFGGAGLATARLWAGPDTLVALSTMGRYPRFLRSLLAPVAGLNRLPFLAPRRWIKQTKKDRELDAIHRAGSICFVADQLEIRRESRPLLPEGPA